MLRNVCHQELPSWHKEVRNTRSCQSKIHFVMCDKMYLLPEATQLTKYMTYIEVKSMEVGQPVNIVWWSWWMQKRRSLVDNLDFCQRKNCTSWACQGNLWPTASAQRDGARVSESTVLRHSCRRIWGIFTVPRLTADRRVILPLIFKCIPVPFLKRNE